MIETSWNSSTHNLDMLHVPDKTILHKTVDRWRTFYPTITCSLKAYRIQMTTWHKLSGMAARERQLTMMQRTTDYWQIVSTSHDTHLQSTTTVQTSDLKFNGRLVTPNYPSTAHSTKLDLETRLRAPTGHKPRTSNRVKMSCEKQLTTQIDKKKARNTKKLDRDSPRNRHLAIYTTMCLNVAGRTPSR